ncbi:MAG: ThiF family adenylyltransferase [Planctomycetota bacterium]|nr:ThiF family adenylyltransferase [Planctomycetota bacterium]
MTDRYARQRILPEFGDAGQERLLGAHAAVVGVGALGCTAADLLARAGVGTVTLIDRDLVERGNLHRQTLFTERDASEGLPKAIAAERRLREVNAEVRVRAVVGDVTPANAAELLLAPTRPGVVLDCTDNFETRYLLNDLCVREGIALCYAGVIGTGARVATFAPGGACLRCVFGPAPAPGSQPTCETAGVLGPAAAVAGAMQAGDAIRVLAGAVPPPPLVRSLDVWTGEVRTMRLPERDPECETCVHGRFEFLDSAVADDAVLCGQDSVQISPRSAGRIDLAAIARRLSPLGEVRATPFMVRARIEGVEFTLFEDARAIVRGTRDAAKARATYAKYIGA